MTEDAAALGSRGVLRSDESTDVTSVALRHGFAHLGRFSGYYHAAVGTFVRVGAGPTGVELAASLAQLAALTPRALYGRIDPATSSIVLVEGGKRIPPTFAESLAGRAAQRLEKLGVKILPAPR